jgi:hypothetical protein
VTNAREFKKFIKPLLNDDGRLAFSRNFIVVAPIRHVLLAIPFHPTSKKTGFHVTTEIEPVFESDGKRSLNCLFTRSGYWPKQNYWISDAEPDFPRSLHEAILEEVLPVLKGLDSVRAIRECFVDRYASGQTWGYWRSLACLDLMLGEFDRVRENVVAPLGRPVQDWLRKVFGDVGGRLIDRGGAIAFEDKRALMAQMHEREAQAIRNFRLEKYWQPTPFPAEEQGLV